MAVAEQLRLFVAVELPPGVRAALAGLQRELRPRCGAGVRWVDAKGIHLTLKFLGGVEGARVPPVQAAVEQAASGQAAFRLSLGSTGFFPNPRRPRVFWVGIEGEVERLGALARRVEVALSPLGFPPERRPFSPHLTLGGVRDGAAGEERRRLGQALGQASLPELPSWE
ncbi:MAG: RNA 2',3'-cyclic phosphodiesterase, partial [Chloroflexota bacterium]